MKQRFESGVFVAGFRKCGTTSVYDFLAQTGMFRVARYKEPQFFCLPDAIVDQHIHWYERLFEGGQQSPILDGSTLYITDAEARSRIRQYVENPRFIICLRDPAKRFFSAYWHQRAKPGGIEQRSFDEILEGLQPAAGNALWQAEQKMLDQAARQGRINLRDLSNQYHRRHYGAPFETEGMDTFAFFRYAGESMYSRFLSPWLDAADTHIMIFENLVEDPERELGRLSAFLQLPPDIPLSLPHNRNKNYNASGSAWLNRLARSGWYDRAKRLAPDVLKIWMREKWFASSEKMSVLQLKTVKEILTEEYLFWEQKHPELVRPWS
ncbi:MAG TPA: sulfotransferase domain-containing protein [Saprospiraceae bacterium]|nr:sulfotransferase domain-containing protein [Saprospiraceae bacterium]